MGAGRPRTPTTFKILSGTQRADRENKNEPIFSHRRTSATRSTSRRTKLLSTCGKTFAKEFLAQGLLNVANKQTLIHICTLQSEIASCEEKIAEEGRWVMIPQFSRKTGEQCGEVEQENIAWRTLRDLRLQYNRLLTEFGGTPSSASKVAAQKKPESNKPGNSFAARYMGNAQKASNG